MKKFFLSALALLGMGTMASAQFYVVKDGEVLYKMESGTPDYVTFEAPAAPTTGTENSHTWVDLGLTSGTKWATCNIGAETPEQYGDYYAWGETATKETYDWSTYKYMNHDNDSYKDTWEGCTKYTYADGQTEGIWYDASGNFIGDNKTELDDADDVVVQIWGGKWKMPTKAQQEELLTECYWVWTDTYNGKSVNGYIVYKAKSSDDKGKMTNESNSTYTPSSSYSVSTDAHIFLPAAGSRNGGKLDDAGSDGYYWSRSLYTYYSDNACYLYFGADYVYAPNYVRGNGFSVRPVCPATK